MCDLLDLKWTGQPRRDRLVQRLQPLSRDRLGRALDHPLPHPRDAAANRHVAAVAEHGAAVCVLQHQLPFAVAALSDRLGAELREKRGLAYSVGASLRPWGDVFRLDVGMGTRPDNLAAAEAGVREVIGALRASPPDAEEVSRVVRAVRGRALMRRMTRISLAYEAAMELVRGREPGDERRALDALDAVDPASVKDVIERRIDPERLARVVVR